MSAAVEESRALCGPEKGKCHLPFGVAALRLSHTEEGVLTVKLSVNVEKVNLFSLSLFISSPLVLSFSGVPPTLLVTLTLLAKEQHL